MITGTSATAKDVKLEKWEITALAEWHRKREEEYANKRAYHDAEEHAARAEYLWNLVE